MDILQTLRETFFDVDAMREALPELLTVGLPNTLLLALCSAVLGTLSGMVLAVCGLSRSRWLRWPARVYTDIFRGLPAAVTILLIGVGLAPVGLQIWGPNPYPLGILALSLIASRLHRRDLPLGHPERGAGPARGGPGAGLLPVHRRCAWSSSRRASAGCCRRW